MIENQYLTVRINEYLFGLPVEKVHDVFYTPKMTPIPLAPEKFVGLLNMRGRIMAAVDMKSCLDLGKTDFNEKTMSVVVEDQGEYYSLIVDKVNEVIYPTPDQKDNIPSTLNPKWLHMAKQIYRLPNELMIVLDLVKVFDD